MFSLTINGVRVIFSKFFSDNDIKEVHQAVQEAGKTRLLFVDSASTPTLAEYIRMVAARGYVPHVVDHHRGEGRTPEAVKEVEAVVKEAGGVATIVTRQEAPACASLVDPLWEKGGWTIIADPDLDGLTAAMKAAGVMYEGLEADAAVFDERPRQSAQTLTPLGWTMVRALSTLPPFNKERPEMSEQAKAELFGAFVSAAQGDEGARAGLEARVATYEAGVAEAERLLAEKMSRPCNGVAFVDSVGAGQSDLNILTKGMEAGGTVVTVVRKDFGPIAGAPGGHGVQYSLAVVRDHQREVDLRTLVPEGMECSPQAGLLSNTSFLLHCSEEVWNSTILPELLGWVNGRGCMSIYGWEYRPEGWSSGHDSPHPDCADCLQPKW